MSKPLRTLEERLALMESGEQPASSPYYICGCGCELFLLMTSGDVVCHNCGYAQLRLLISELAPVGQEPEKLL